MKRTPLKRTPLRRTSPKRRERSGDVVLAFPKPKQAAMPTGAFLTHEDGREVCYTVGTVKQSRKGRNEYRRRLAMMLERQKGMCCLFGIASACPGYLELACATFEHENGRGGGKRDDRIEVNGRWINGAAHYDCNNWKGSRRIDYNTALQARAKRPLGRTESDQDASEASL